MIEVAANISMLFRERPFLERPAAAAEAGFRCIECWWPFDHPDPDDAQREAFVAAVVDAGVSLTALNFYGGNLAAGDRGVLSVPAVADDFRRNIGPAVSIAGELGCTVLHALYGNRALGVDPRQQDELAVEQLASAAGAAQAIGATVVVEALNPWENPLYPVTRTSTALAVLDRVRSATGARLALLYDLYHVQRAEGDLIATIRRHAGRFGHVQLADSPGRGEPGTGEVAFDRVLRELETAGYAGRIGLEYAPTTTTLASLEAVRALGLLDAAAAS